MWKPMTVTAFIALLSGCAHQPQIDRKTANEEEVKSNETWFYSWSNSSMAAKNPKDFVNAQFQNAQSCIAKFKTSEEEIKNCEGNGFNAGPGLYVCDNPFTSHDYGDTFVMMKTKANKTNIANAPYMGPANPMDREIYGNPATAAVIYDFRASIFNTKAMVLRDASIIDEKSVASFDLKTVGFKKFSEHAAYTCTASTPVENVFKSWGDHMEFMSLTFMDKIEYSPEAFYKNNQLTDSALVAAIASDAVGDGSFEKNLSAVIKKYHLQDSVSDEACAESETRSIKSCLARRLFDSIHNNVGTDRNPTYSWELPTTLGILADLKIISSTDQKKITTNEKLINVLAAGMRKNSVQMQRVLEAYQCMKSVSDKIQNNHLDMWIQYDH